MLGDALAARLGRLSPQAVFGVQEITTSEGDGSVTPISRASRGRTE
jgi:hypothetical protein